MATTQKHTAGPWRYRKSVSGRAIFAPDESVVAYTMGNNSALGMERERSGENEANARLIAAAPTLLIALTEVVADLQFSEVPQHRNLVKLARAALAAASGAHQV